MEPLRRSTRITKRPVWVDEEEQDSSVFLFSGDLITVSIPKRARKDDEDDDHDYDPKNQGPAKRSKTSRAGALARRRSKIPEGGKISAGSKFNNDIWMVIIEYCTPAVLQKVCCLSKNHTTLINRYKSLFVHCRMQTYGLGLQVLPEGLSERKFSILLEGKGCMGCDNKRATTTYWTWCKRWCTKCLEREVISETSARQILMVRSVPFHLEDQIIDALPWGMTDSWGKPHPLLEEEERPYFRGVVKAFSRGDLETLYDNLHALTPATPERRTGMTTTEFLAAITNWHQELDALPMIRDAFFHQHNANAKKVMEKALVIDKAVRAKGRKEKAMNKKNRLARAKFFKECAEVDLPEVPAEVVKISKTFLEATRMGTDKGSWRSWSILKPKIQKEWDTLYEDGMKKVMWEHDVFRREWKRTAALEIERQWEPQ